MSRISGKVSVTLIIVVAFVAGLIVMALAAGKSPSSSAADFMEALAAGDYQSLAKYSYADGVSTEELEDQWKYTMEVVAPHYQFTYEIKGETRPDDKSAIVRMMFVKNAGASGTYDEPFELPMVNRDGDWKVDVYAMNRDMFPGLPRG